MLEFDIKLTAKHLDVIAAALGKMPYIEVFQIINEISKQVGEQSKPNTGEACSVK